VEGDRTDTETPLREQLGRGYKVPNGTAYTNVKDLARFASFLMGKGPESALKATSLEQDLDQIEVSSNSWLTGGYGLGFMVTRRDGYVAFGHSGDVAGYQAALYINRDKKIGLIVLANVGGLESIDAEEIALKSLDLLSK
jgi:CubicO group peptidase (beta-lactamase class C family)